VTYWQMDDKFLGHHKTIRALRAGAEALQMWLALRNYVAHNETDGEIPDEDIDDLPGAPCRAAQVAQGARGMRQASAGRHPSRRAR
jgi:hypothetical protein